MIGELAFHFRVNIIIIIIIIVIIIIIIIIIIIVIIIIIIIIIITIIIIMTLPRQHFHRVALHPPGRPTALRPCPRTVWRKKITKIFNPMAKPGIESRSF